MYSDKATQYALCKMRISLFLERPQIMPNAVKERYSSNVDSPKYSLNSMTKRSVITVKGLKPTSQPPLMLENKILLQRQKDIY